MITTKSELKDYIEKDLEANGVRNPGSIKGKIKQKIKLQFSKLLKYHILLREYEFYYNTASNPFTKLLKYYYQYNFTTLSYELGIQIKPNCFGPGLSIRHYGDIVVNSKARIGSNCVLHSGTNIGDKNGCPIIGDNVYVGPGAKIFGRISIGNGVKIGANAVVNKDIPDNCVVAGIPARIIKRLNPETGVWEKVN